ncbi:MAG: ribonuclease P protein component 3 [Methanosarcina flavescens]|uniref:Ribonuclease P protein component 3 n=1 Tax=Methanosarcina flavescens TaxID=1715806 RepID=A0A660HNU0_9EURY|nr:ribonuclease P protein component 3 [Methanosarcina flavescens]AYK13933.1 ribonuclease P protein component 3 [Methanosarcina flavescens]NLK32469.1 ribonuclease P protein component 3 [Methanosarcina flavescens]
MGKPKFYDFCVHAVPDGENTAEQLAALARHFGYSGIALANHSDKLPQSQPVLSSTNEFEVFRGIELVEENPSKLHGLIGKFRKSVDVLIVHGGSENVNRAALENPKVDILNHPAFDKSSGLNQVLAKAAAENNVAIGLTLRSLLHSRGPRRVRLLSDLRANLDLARKYDVSLVLSSDAMSCFDLRSPMDALALAEVCGLEEDEALEAMTTVPERIISRNRLGPGYIREGVEVLEEGNYF